MIRQLFSEAARLVLDLVCYSGVLGRPRVILSRDATRPYLSRWYVTARPTHPDGGEPFDDTGQPRPGTQWADKPFSILVHRFHSSDDGDALHNHPWSWAFSIVLAGGYVEERFDSTTDGNVRRRRVLPFSINWIDEHDFHRAELVEHDAWTIFVTGPKVSTWGFMEKLTWDFVPWREWIARHRAKENLFLHTEELTEDSWKVPRGA